MVDATGYFGGNYLKAKDISGSISLTIKEVRPEKMQDSDREKLVVYFDEIDKGLVLNKINTTRIIKWTGTKETGEWLGAKITLVKDSVEYDGQDVDCIRVKKKEEEA